MCNFLKFSLTLVLATSIIYADPKEFFLTGDLEDLKLIHQYTHTNVGKVTVLTQPINEYASQAIQGHLGVTSSVLRGFRKLNIPMNYNPTTIDEVGDHIFVLVDVNALRQAIELKRIGRIKTLIVGPNIMNNPKEDNHLLGSQEVDCYIAPCNWARDCNTEEEPLIKDKTAIWYAGVDTSSWQPTSSKAEKKRVLIYWKTEPESFCAEIENLLDKHGFETVRLQYGNYNAEQYKQVLEQVDAAVFISVSESQGIALAECWAMNVPTFVWNPGKAFIYNRWIKVSSAPYLTAATGRLWANLDELEKLLTNFDQSKNQFFPRAWVCNYMSDESSIHLLMDLIGYIWLSL